MRFPRVRFTARRMMVVMAAVAFDMGLARWITSSAYSIFSSRRSWSWSGWLSRLMDKPMFTKSLSGSAMPTDSYAALIVRWAVPTLQNSSRLPTIPAEIACSMAPRSVVQ